MQLSRESTHYTDDQKKEIYLFSQLNAVENFMTGTISTRCLE